MSIVIIGAGYVGLVSGACLAELGAAVTLIDSDSRKTGRLREGVMPIYEPGLAEIVSRNRQRLAFSSEFAPHVPRAKMVFLAVGTPSLDSGEADLSAVFAAAREAAPYLADGAIVTIKSTVPPGTAAHVAREIATLRPGFRFAVASNPEFLREGSAVIDFLDPDRIVVGISDGRLHAPFEELYQPLSARGVPLVFMSNEAAELTKYAANTYLAMRIAYVNELADLCEATGADIGEVAGGMGLDSRIGLHYLAPGPGFGGSCFPKDTSALMAAARARGVELTLGEAIVASNSRRKDRLFSKVCRALGGQVAGKRVCILGLAFKANTDDVRDSAALPLIGKLQAAGARIKVYDPEAMENASKQLRRVEWARDAFEAAENSDLAVIMTEWEEFRTLDLGRLAQEMRTPVMLDFRNLYDLSNTAAAGLSYISVGRAAVERLAIPPSRRRTAATRNSLAEAETGLKA